jgi:hypothetical protein
MSVVMDLNVFTCYLNSMVQDERITVWHMAMIFGFIRLATTSDLKAPIYISRKKVMRLSHIKNFMTYHKCIKDLQQFGYIQYFPSYHPAIGSRVHLIKK